MAERLIPVRSESEIRIGAIYFVKNPDAGEPRFLILGTCSHDDHCDELDLGCAGERGYRCTDGDYCLAYTIELGDLFRVEDNLDLNESNPYLVSKPKERVNERR